MTDIKKAFYLETPDKIREEIKVREKLITQMVGNMYPGILRNEISQLRELLYSKFKEIA